MKRTFKSHPVIISLFLLLATFGCRKDEPIITADPIIDASEVPSGNYLRVDNSYYPIDTASVWFSKDGNLTLFDISFLNDADQFLQIGYLIHKNTEILKDGEFQYQPLKDFKSLKEDHFYNASLRISEKVLDGISGSKIKSASVRIKKAGIKTEINALLEIDAKKVEVHYIGSPEIVEYW